MLLSGYLRSPQTPSIQHSAELFRARQELEEKNSSPVFPLVPVLPPTGNLWYDVEFWLDSATWED